MIRRTALFASALLTLSAPCAFGCSGDGEVILIGGENVKGEDIDRDPLALLPRGVVMLGYLDAQTMFQTGLGPDIGRLVANLLPLGPESNFVPARDVVKLYGGMYAMQGADFCVIAQGNFDTEAIGKAADARAVTAFGLPLVKSRYADRDMYTAGNVGFVVLTSHTALSGNETGMRRALDRLRFGKLERSVPSWMIDLTSTKGAAFAVAGDLTSQPGIAEAAGQLPFVSGLRNIRILGNFQPPGVNFVGALTYADAASAQNGASSLQNVRQLTQFMSLLSSLGFGGSVPPMQVAQNGNDVAFTLPLDDRFVRLLLGRVVDLTRPGAFAPPH